MYTDGSKTCEGVVGCAVFHYEQIYTKKLPDQTGIFNAELRAILKAVKIIRDDTQLTSTVIFTDSQSVQVSLENRKTTHPLICKIHRKLLEIHEGGRSVEVCWVPAHVGIPNNERADEGARSAAESDAPISDPAVHYKDYYPIIREKITDKWQEYWLSLQSNKLRTIKTTVTPWNSSMEISRRLDVVLCRLMIGHTRLTQTFN